MPRIDTFIGRSNKEVVETVAKNPCVLFEEILPNIFWFFVRPKSGFALFEESGVS
jgi:hypothetical protein